MNNKLFLQLLVICVFIQANIDATMSFATMSFVTNLTGINIINDALNNAATINLNGPINTIKYDLSEIVYVSLSSLTTNITKTSYSSKLGETLTFTNTIFAPSGPYLKISYITPTPGSPAGSGTIVVTEYDENNKVTSDPVSLTFSTPNLATASPTLCIMSAPEKPSKLQISLAQALPLCNGNVFQDLYVGAAGSTVLTKLPAYTTGSTTINLFCLGQYLIYPSNNANGPAILLNYISPTSFTAVRCKANNGNPSIDPNLTPLSFTGNFTPCLIRTAYKDSANILTSDNQTNFTVYHT